jgi:hypothetical protein
MTFALWLMVVAPAIAAGTGGSEVAAETEPIDIPYFARRYDLPCAQCHVTPPKLNEFGRAFLERGYALPGRASGRTWPFAIWLSGRADALGGEAGGVAYLNRLELISGGEVFSPWLSYFVEWRPLSFEPRSDGSLRDRSGRFEDLFLTVSYGGFEAMVGQFRQVQQVDVSQRVSLSEPLVLSAAVPWRGEAESRERSLRGFAPAARSPAVRLAAVGRPGGGWRWTNAISLPFPGELALPLTREARREASNELWLDPKGLFVESYVRRGLSTVGAHALVAEGGGRFLVNAVATGASGPWHWTALAGGARAGPDEPVLGRWSLEGELYPTPFAGLGVRVEDRAGDAAARAILPYAAVHFPGTRYTIRLVVEQRFQQGRNATLLELGTVF